MRGEVVLWTCITLAVLLGIIGMIIFAISASNMKKRRKEMQLLQEGIAVGNRILFAGGIYGKIVGVNEETLSVEVAGRVIIEISRYAVQSVMT